MLIVLVLWTIPAHAENAWHQWGGDQRNFQCSSQDLAATWPEQGPALLWERPLGDGYSAILADNGRLFTMYHQDGNEIVVAVDEKTGKDLWRQEYVAGLTDTMNLEFGPGPLSTPALAGDRLLTVGMTLKVHALDADDGSVLWQKDLKTALDAPQMPRGYGASPLLYEDLVIIAPGAKPGNDGGVVALNQADGTIAWKSAGFGPSYSSPILADVDGKPQVMIAAANKRAGLAPRTGKILWEIELRAESSTIMSTQLWDPKEHILFGSSAYADGSRAIKVEQKDDQFVAEELWYSRKMRVQHATAVRAGDLVYGSSGDFGPAFITALDIKTGELAFRQRGFSKANLLRVGEQLLILDEDGTLALGIPGREGIEILAKAKILERISWTVPTLIGTRLYVRDRKSMKAFELADAKG